jgi:hypothetical protein
LTESAQVAHLELRREPEVVIWEAAQPPPVG